MKKLSAFTLAEVLITLGVIGIVAAMTMPSLIANYQKKVWVNQLKKSVSVLEQGFRKMLADEGVDSLLDTKAWTDNTVSYNLCDYLGAGDCLGIENGLKTYFKISKIGDDGSGSQDYSYSYLNKKNQKLNWHTWIVFADGMTLFDSSFYVHSGMDCSDGIDAQNCKIAAADFKIDVNGQRGPNRIGRDIFGFILSTDGRLIPFYSLEDKKSYSGQANDYWRDDASKCGTPGKSDAEEKSDGFGCAARIIENGWEMDY